MYNNFTEEARKILINAKNEMKNLKHPYVGSEHLLLAILKTNCEITNRLKEYDLDYDNFKSQIIKIVGTGTKVSNCFLYTPLLKRVMETAMIDSRENNNGNVTVNHLFSAILEEGEGIAVRIMLGMGIDLDEVYSEFANKLIKVKKNGKLLLEELGVDLTKKALNGELDPVIGRDKDIKRILEILSRRKKNNPILIGEAGVGKTAIVEQLSRMIALGEVPRNLKNKRIISVDMASTVAGTKYRGEFEERIHKLLKELEENDDIILFIDEIHTIVGAGGAEGAIDASNIFKPALARNKVRLIGATTIQEYKKYINDDRALDRRFQRVYIEEPNNDALKDILSKLKETYQNYHHVVISDEMLDLIIELSNKYILDRKQPDKAIDILDEVCAHVSLKENKQVKKYNEINKDLKDIIERKKLAILNNDYKKATDYKVEENKLMTELNELELNLYNKSNNHHIKVDDIIKVVSMKANVPIYRMSNQKNINLKLIETLKKNVIGQDEAILELSKIYKQIKLGFKDDKCYSLMFAGPTGVGKTMLAKDFGKYLSRNVIKIDMTEFSESHSISKLIGSPAGYVGYNDSNNILDRVRDNPFSVIILDEFDKAHSNVINLFFQALDDGVITDAKGTPISFKNAVIIMTTNVGYEQNSIGFNGNLKTQVIKDNFGISFVNRIDKVIGFNNLKNNDITKIIKNKLTNLRNKYSNVKITISKNAVNEIIDTVNYQEFGARKIDKVIKQNIEDKIITNLLENKSNIIIKSIREKQAI